VSGGEIPTATWARLRDGAWGLRVQGEARTGDTVRAVRASGASALVRVGRIVWSGEGVTLATAGEEVREPRAEAAPRRRGGSRRAAPVEAPALVVQAPAPVEAPVEATLALAVGRLGTEARAARAEGRADAGDLAAAAHRALDAWIAEAAPVEAAPASRGILLAPVPAPVAEAPVQAAAEPPRAPGCKPWRRCLSGGCAACAPDAAPPGGVPF
jgi:hypothetical protein